MSTLWKNDSSIRKWVLPRPCEYFQKKYNAINKQIRALSCADDLLSGICPIILCCVLNYICLFCMYAHAHVHVCVFNMYYTEKYKPT